MHLNKLIESQIVNNCKKGLGYNAVPPSYTGNFMPPTPDLSFTGLDEFINKPVVENRKSDEEVSKVLRKSDDSPIIEDWVSDSEEENVDCNYHHKQFQKQRGSNACLATNATRHDESSKLWLKKTQLPYCTKKRAWISQSSTNESEAYKAFRVFNSRTRIVEENLHIRFSESILNVVGTKASDNADQARKETEPVKNYILLPLWTANPPFSQDPKELSNDGCKPSS
ncbi:hypothetical protein Tco_0522635 [Tanacetum coccineum]